MRGFFRKNPRSASPEAVIQRIGRLLFDDDLQLRALGPQEYSHFSSLSAIDQHPNADGEFGRSVKNPIPTNGPVGSISYLSNLSTDSGHKITFHRVKVVDGIDIYEYVSLAGTEWGTLCVDMYHSRKSKLTPDGLCRTPTAQQFIGFNHFWDDFPMGYAEQKAKMPAELRLLFAPISVFTKEMTGRSFERPEAHKLLMQALRVAR